MAQNEGSFLHEQMDNLTLQWKVRSGAAPSGRDHSSVIGFIFGMQGSRFSPWLAGRVRQMRQAEIPALGSWSLAGSQCW